MKTKTFFSIVVLCSLFITAVNAQSRYTDEVFSDIQVTADYKYGENYSFLTGVPVLTDLKMDVYFPADDTVGGPYYEATRPVIILAHAGSFLPKDAFLPFGDKNDSSFIEMCTQFAKRGWVAVSINYRLGWNPLGATETIRKSTIINAVYRGMQDTKACVRYFRKDAATADTYRIDPYRIAVGGSNSGGYLALALSSLNKGSEIELLKFLDPATGESVIDTSVSGGFDGEGGCIGLNAPLNNAGYSSAAQVILNMGGAIGDTTWQEAGETPIVSFHGELDPLTPYMTAVVIVSATGQPVVEVSGSHDLSRRAANLGNQQIFYALNLTDPYTQVAESRTGYEGLLGFPGPANGYEPWAWYDSTLTKIARPSVANPGYTGFGSAANPFASRAKAEVYIDSVMNYFTPRALAAFANIDSAAANTADKDNAPVDCSIGIAFNTVPDAAVQIYPNPASSDVYIRVLDGKYSMQSLRVLDISGKEVRSEAANGAAAHVVKRNGLQAGVYFINVLFSNGSQTYKQIVLE